MNTQPELEFKDQEKNTNEFVYLLFGLDAYIKNPTTISNNLRRVLNRLAFTRSDIFPKTMRQFIELCHQPISSWYPFAFPEDFHPSQAILDHQGLSEEAQYFYLTLTEQLQLSAAAYLDIPQAALDVLEMIDMRLRLRKRPDTDMAQELYVQVRSFLIENSWTTIDQLRACSLELREHLRAFYIDIPSFWGNEIFVCERCGLLELRNGRWQGVKPGFCSDHGSGSSIQSIKNTGSILRLREGIHLRVFLPGRLELALFNLAENLQTAYSEHLQSVERYPGLDTYDLRLNFVDQSWAIDAKDHTRAESLAAQIHPLYNEGSLSHTHAFYVIPAARMDDVNYREQLERRTQGMLSPHLQITSLSAFQQLVEEKLDALTKAPRRQQDRKA